MPVSGCAKRRTYSPEWLDLNCAVLALQCFSSLRPFCASQCLLAQKLNPKGFCIARIEWSEGRSHSPSGYRSSSVPQQNMLDLVAPNSGWWPLLYRNLGLPVRTHQTMFRWSSHTYRYRTNICFCTTSAAMCFITWDRKQLLKVVGAVVNV